MNKQILKAILIDVVPLETSKIEAYKRLEELESLVKTYGGIVVIKTIQRRGIPNYKTFIGSGKISELIEEGEQKEANIIIINNIVKPRQLFELGEILRKEKMEAWDRVDLILKIFDKHAQSTEAKLQIDLARIRHMGPRIFKMGGELMQQEGARGTRGGPGETNTEIMKRHLSQQEKGIMEKLKHYDIIKEGHRKRRKRQYFKTAALVGYTNAGKSSLLHALTGKDVYIADELFATLDTKVGNLYIEETHKEILLSDTIGFIQDLPPFLIQAFKSTLAEAIDSDLLLHVIDLADPMYEQKIIVVEDILIQLGLQDKQKIYVFNKVDLMEEQARLQKLARKKEEEAPPRILSNSILPAGRKTAEYLGWVDTDKEIEAIKRSPNVVMGDLGIKYKEFTPVFVSAYKKKSLGAFIKKISDTLEKI